jgi:hypothetical protein
VQATLCSWKDIEPGNVEVRVERPEQLNAARRRRVCAEPVQQEVRGMRGRQREGQSPCPTMSDLPCHADRNNQNQDRRGDTVRGGPVEVWKQQIRIRKRGNGGAPHNEGSQPARARRTMSRQRWLAGPPHGEASENVTNRTRHQPTIIADSAELMPSTKV